ncbi:MAG: AAA family ATPase [Planctomycetes bacterium]|nr:AAA family ATPase [Planctomycetota bacterium]
MQLQRLKIPSFRNLRDFEITFTGSTTDADGTARTFKSHAVIGQNGSGKSNMIEALVTIFRDLDLYERPSFDYEMDYLIRGHQIQITASEGRDPWVKIDGEYADPWLLSDTNDDFGEDRGDARLYLPSHVFTYYSGKNERLESLFQAHQERYLENVNDLGEIIDSGSLLRRLFYCRHPHSRLVLLACLLAPEKPLKDILHDLRIEDVDSVLFTLKKPYRLSGDLSAAEIQSGDNRFWFDNTRFTEEFLTKLWELATAPIDYTEEKTVDFRGRKEPQELLYLYLKDKDALTQLKDHIGDSYRFFQYVEGSYIADLLDDVRIFVKHKNTYDLISFEQLSEGELQLLTVLGLMRITHQDECLFLLDEPDTHLNPIWKLRFFDEIEKVLKQDDDEIIKGDSQIIITTHDPMMIGSLRKEQVRILRNHADHTEVTTPNDHPQGMGVAGLLKSDMFGLPSTLDRQTLEMLQERNSLIALRANAELTEQQQGRLERLSSVLDDLGFAHAYRDPQYQKFIELMYATRGRPLDELFTPDEFKEHEQLASRIVEELVKREKTDELSDLAQELHLEVKPK